VKGLALLLTAALMVAGGMAAVEAAGTPPAQPVNLAPSDNATEVSLNPTLQCSAFSDNDTEDTHRASQWQITATADNYTSPVFDTTITGSDNLTQMAVPGGKLSDNTTYYWQVRHRDSHDAWSEWSAQTSFTSLNHAPAAPAIDSPLSGESVNTTVTLKSSAFSDPDANDSHGASRWQMTATSGDYSDAALVLDDITVKDSERTSVTVFAGVLKPLSTYCWRVKHQDSHGAWSDWSPEASFTTVNRPPDKAAELTPKSGTLGVITTATLEAEFSDPDGDPDYAASQWQITAAAGDYSSPVWDHTSDAAYTTVPAGTLSTGTDYYWHVRHQDKQGEWSEWSDEAAFTTWTGLPSVGGGGMPFWGWLLIALGGAAAVTFAILALRSRSQQQVLPRHERRRG
jgi:hypothetical protein